MINLIPKEEKKKMVLDFYSRLVVLLFVALDFCILVAFLSLLPSYFISTVKDDFLDTKLELQKEEDIARGQQSLVRVKEVNEKLDILEGAAKNQFLLSAKVVNAILLKKRSDIKISRIFYEDNQTQGKKITLTGTAPSREILLLFSRALSDDSTFKSVNLPVSNFVKGSNIQFSLTLTPA